MRSFFFVFLVLASSVTGHNYKRLTYDRDLVMSLRSTKNAVPPASFLQGLNAEEKMLVLSGAGMQDEEETLFEADAVLPERETDSKEEYVASEEGSSDNEHRAKLPKPGIGAWIAPSAIGNLVSISSCSAFTFSSFLVLGYVS